MDAAGGAVSYVSNVTAQFSSLKTDPRPLAPWPHSAHPASPQIDATVLQQQTAASPPPSPSQANLSRIESTFKNCLNLTWPNIKLTGVFITAVPHCSLNMRSRGPPVLPLVLSTHQPSPWWVYRTLSRATQLSSQRLRVHTVHSIGHASTSSEARPSCSDIWNCLGVIHSTVANTAP